jgi:hypothetical protein
MFMFHMQVVLQAFQRVRKENNIQYVRSDPASRDKAEFKPQHAAKRRHPYQLSDAREMLSQKDGPRLYQLASHYEGFNKVQSLGGLLPCPFRRSELTATASFMPHLQLLKVAETWEDVQCCWQGMESPLRIDAASQVDGLSPTAKAHELSKRWDVDALKDALLVPELM